MEYRKLFYRTSVSVALLFGLVCAAQTLTAVSLSESAMALTQQNVTYDGSYFSIEYPNGDVPSDKRVCTDVIIRAYRTLGMTYKKRCMMI